MSQDTERSEKSTPLLPTHGGGGAYWALMGRSGTKCKVGKVNYPVPFRDGDQVWLVAIRDIAPGEEIYVAYGQHYWKGFQDLSYDKH